MNAMKAINKGQAKSKKNFKEKHNKKKVPYES